MPPVLSDIPWDGEDVTDSPVNIDDIQPIVRRKDEGPVPKPQRWKEELSDEQLQNIHAGYDEIDVSIPDGINLVILFGITQSGKSNLLMYMLSRPENIKFDNYVIFCLSAEQDLYRGFPRECVKECTSESIEREIDIQDKIFKKTGKTSCFIFDDLIGAVSFQKNSVIDRLSVSGRHSGITSLLLAQDAGKVSSCQRDNCAVCFVTVVKNHSLEHLSKMQLEDPKRFIAQITATFKDKYSVKRVECQQQQPLKVFKVPEQKKLVKFIL